MFQRRKKLDLLVSDELLRDWGAMASEAGISREDVLRQGLAIMKCCKEQKALGRRHLGFVSDPSLLDVEVTGVL